MAGNGSTLPKGWKQVQITELLDEDQSRVLHRLLNDIKDEKRPVTDLKTWLVSLRSQLEPKGVLPEYLYYLLCYEFKLSL